MTQIKISEKSNYTSGEEFVILPIFEDETGKLGRKVFEMLSRAQTKAVKTMLSRNSPENSEIKISGAGNFIPVFSSDKTVVVQILGKKLGFDTRSAREAGEKISGVCKSFQQKKCTILEGGFSKNDKKIELLRGAYFEGIALGTYEFNTYRGQKFLDSQEKSGAQNLEKITIISDSETTLESKIQKISEAVKLTKDIINTPPSIANPEFVSDLAEKVFSEISGVTVSVIHEKELKKLGAGGILGVGQAGTGNSRFLVIEYSGGVSGEAPLGLVGKGVTYDTGGLSLKPAAYMAGMKQDLGGCATVLGGMYLLSSLGIKKNVVAVTPLAENLVSRDAYKPDDVVTMINGKTVEITNTDAEGRLLLGDALCYLESTFSPKAMIDLATLTGACAYAVGNDFTAAMGNNQDIVDTVLSASKTSDEPVWQLPLHKKYEEFLKSPIADLVNSTQGKLKAGTIEAALFLNNFIAEKTDKKDVTPWCHLDIASVAFDDGKKLATGRNVRLLLEIAERV